MVGNTINGKIKVYNLIPKVFELKPNIMNYDKLDIEIHFKDGFRDLIKPEISQNQYLGSIYFDKESDVYTYEVLQYTPEQIEQNKVNNEFTQYQIRQQRGLESYLKLCAEFRISKEEGKLTPEHYAAIEEVLIPVRDELVNGQFITAKTKLEQIGFDVIGEDLYNRFIDSLNKDIEELYLS